MWTMSNIWPLQDSQDSETHKAKPCSPQHFPRKRGSSLTVCRSSFRYAFELSLPLPMCPKDTDADRLAKRIKKTLNGSSLLYVIGIELKLVPQDNDMFTRLESVKKVIMKICFISIFQSLVSTRGRRHFLRCADFVVSMGPAKSMMCRERCRNSSAFTWTVWLCQWISHKLSLIKTKTPQYPTKGVY